MADDLRRESNGVKIQLPGNSTEQDFRDVLKLAVQIMGKPESVQSEHRAAVVLTLLGWVKNAKVVS